MIAGIGSGRYHCKTPSFRALQLHRFAHLLIEALQKGAKPLRIVEVLEALHVAKSSGRVGTYFSESGELKSLANECQRLMQEIIGFKGIS